MVVNLAVSFSPLDCEFEVHVTLLWGLGLETDRQAGLGNRGIEVVEYIFRRFRSWSWKVWGHEVPLLRGRGGGWGKEGWW